MEYYGSPRLIQLGSLGSPSPLDEKKAEGPQAINAPVREIVPALFCVRGARPKPGARVIAVMNFDFANASRESGLTGVENETSQTMLI